MNSIAHSFMDPAAKAQLSARLAARLAAFERSVATGAFYKKNAVNGRRK